MNDEMCGDDPGWKRGEVRAEGRGADRGLKRGVVKVSTPGRWWGAAMAVVSGARPGWYRGVIVRDDGSRVDPDLKTGEAYLLRRLAGTR